MKSRLFTYLLGLYFLIGGYVHGQQGDFFLKHFHPGDDFFDAVNFKITQHDNGIIYVANRQGILQFDGLTWELIRTPGAVFDLIAEEQSFYVSGSFGLGIVRYHDDSDLIFESIYRTAGQTEEIFDILLTDSMLYAISPAKLWAYSIDGQNMVHTIEAADDDQFEALYQLNDQILVNTATSGLLQVEEDHLIIPKHQAWQDLRSITFIDVSETSGYGLIGTADNQLLVNRSGTVNSIHLKDKGYLADSEIIDGRWVNDTLIVVGTLKGGIGFFNPLSGELIQIVNYHNGLPDNEISAMTVDDGSSVWVAHEYGYTRISPFYPFRSFTRFPGLEGNLLSVALKDGQRYVATSLGLFQLKEIKDIEEVIYYVQKEPLSKPAYDEAAVKSRKGLFGFLRKKKRRRPKPTKDAEPAQLAEHDVLDIKNNTEAEKIVDQQVRSIRYVYAPVRGIKSKTTQLVNFQGKLLAASLDGIFEIRGDSAYAISAEPARFLFASDHSKSLFLSTYQGELMVYDHTPQGWAHNNLMEGFKDQITYIFEDGEFLWLCTSDLVYCLEIDQGSVFDVREYALENPHYSETLGLVYQNMPTVINNTGFFQLQEGDTAFVRIDGFPDLSRYMADNRGGIWGRSSDRWMVLQSHENNPRSQDLLNFFQDVIWIHADEQLQNFWIITGNNELYNFQGGSLSELRSAHQLFLKRVRNTQKHFKPVSNLSIHQDESSLTFEFVQPDYSGILGIQYRYKLEGLNNSWSDWSPYFHTIKYPYLPPASYKLYVETKNILGDISQIEPINLNIIPPYWQRPWFYALEVLMLVILFMITVKVKALGFRYRLLSRLLAFLTLIIVIELIQTIAEAKLETETSPVLDFGIKVFVAIAILPVEAFLRRHVFKEEVSLSEIFSLKPKQENANEEITQKTESSHEAN